MEYKKVMGLLSILVLSLLIAGCSFGGSKDSSGIEQQEIYTGTGAIDIKFVSETIPNWEVEAPYTLQLSAELVNKGAHAVTNGQVIVEGFPQQQLQQTFQATGKTAYQSEGYPVRVNFPSITITDDKPFLLTACYPYKTWFKGSLCYDPDMSQNSNLVKACKFQQSYSSKDLGNGQGAPVAVTDIEVRRKENGDKADLVVRLRNLGGGQLMSPLNPTIECQQQQIVGTEYKNRARITKLMFNNINIQSSCSYNKDDQGLIQFSQSGEATLDCEASSLAIGGAGLRSFEIEFDYGYVTQSSTANIKVKKTFV